MENSAGSDGIEEWTSVAPSCGWICVCVCAVYVCVCVKAHFSHVCIVIICNSSARSLTATLKKKRMNLKKKEAAGIQSVCVCTDSDCEWCESPLTFKTTIDPWPQPLITSSNSFNNAALKNQLRPCRKVRLVAMATTGLAIRIKRQHICST